MTTIAINLLPHRIEKRKQRRRDFFTLTVIAAVAAGVLVLLVGGVIQTYIYAQTSRNEFIKQENLVLDKQIAEVASLKEEIDALRARQTAVEDLQSDRNMPVYMLDEMVKLVPEGVYLRSIHQDGQKVTLVGLAQSNERVSELLRNFANRSQWIERPNLIEIKLGAQGLNLRGPRLYEFSMDVLLKRPSSVKEAAAAPAVTTGTAK